MRKRSRSPISPPPPRPSCSCFLSSSPARQEGRGCTKANPPTAPSPSPLSVGETEMGDAVILAFKPFATPSPRFWAVQKDEEKEEEQSTAPCTSLLLHTQGAEMDKETEPSAQLPPSPSLRQVGGAHKDKAGRRMMDAMQ